VVNVTSKENEIFTPEEMATLLASAPGHLIPGMAVKAFAGVRTEEMAKIDWSHIQFDRNCIKLPSKITKLRQRRLIQMHPNLRAWLVPHRKPEGRLCERWTTPQSVFQAWARHAETVGIKVGENKFRNSFISYRLAQTNDIGLVARESGNSAEVIQREYLEITTPEEAAKWFSTFPPGYKKEGSAAPASLKKS
jgi:integrase